jgi:hypothetical protein
VAALASTLLGAGSRSRISQLYRAPGIDGIAAGFIGRLFLGMGFDAFDLISYSAGVGLGCAVHEV